MDMQQAGERLKALRKEKSITQEELAEVLGVSNRTVSRWENGRNMPDFDVLLQLAKFYNTDVNRILTGESNLQTEECKEYCIAEYTNEEKLKLTKLLHYVFIAGLICIVAYTLALFWNYSSPLTDFLRGFGLGGSMGTILCGVIFTSKYSAKLRQSKKRLVSKITSK